MVSKKLILVTIVFSSQAMFCMEPTNASSSSSSAQSSEITTEELVKSLEQEASTQTALQETEKSLHDAEKAVALLKEHVGDTLLLYFESGLELLAAKINSSSPDIKSVASELDVMHRIIGAMRGILEAQKTVDLFRAGERIEDTLASSLESRLKNLMEEINSPLTLDIEGAESRLAAIYNILDLYGEGHLDRREEDEGELFWYPDSAMTAGTEIDLKGLQDLRWGLVEVSTAIDKFEELNEIDSIVANRLRDNLMNLDKKIDQSASKQNIKACTSELDDLLGLLDRYVGGRVMTADDGA